MELRRSRIASALTLVVSADAAWHAEPGHALAQLFTLAEHLIAHDGDLAEDDFAAELAGEGWRAPEDAPPSSTQRVLAAIADGEDWWRAARTFHDRPRAAGLATGGYAAETAAGLAASDSDAAVRATVAGLAGGGDAAGPATVTGLAGHSDAARPATVAGQAGHSDAARPATVAGLAGDCDAAVRTIAAGLAGDCDAAVRAIAAGLAGGTEPAVVAQLARRSSMVTHAHGDDRDAAAVQACAVALALAEDDLGTVDADKFVTILSGQCRGPRMRHALTAAGTLCRQEATTPAQAAAVLGGDGQGGTAPAAAAAALTGFLRHPRQPLRAIEWVQAMGAHWHPAAIMTAAIGGAANPHARPSIIWQPVTSQRAQILAVAAGLAAITPARQHRRLRQAS